MILRDIIEAALFASPHPLTVDELKAVFEEADRPDTNTIAEALAELADFYSDRPIQLQLVAGGYRFQVRPSFSPWVSRLFEERPVRYSRALLETLAIIVHRQPVTRGEIEEIRGVAVSTSIIRTLQERDWVQVVGFREVPGRPALYATTREFLNYFNLRNLDELPPLPDLPDPQTSLSADSPEASEPA